MTQKDEALKMAIECLEYHYNNDAWGMDIEGVIEACKAALLDNSFTLPDGWVAVPVQPTKEMFYAGQDAPCGIGGSPASPTHVWEAMLQAAPTNKEKHMSEFEKWFETKYVDASESTKIVSLKAWQAAKADSEQEIAELKTHINDLREALEENHYCNSSEKAINLYNAAISKTPAQSLTEFENCALLTIREQLEPKIDILFSGINKLPVGVYNLVPIRKD